MSDIYCKFQPGIRKTGYGAPSLPGGWDAWTQRIIDCVNFGGFDGAWLHNPYGVKAGEGSAPAPERMQLAARSFAEQEGYHVPLGRMLRRIVAATNKPVVCYFGMSDRATYPKTYDPATLIDNAYSDWLAEALASGASIALDSIVDESDPSFVALARSLNIAGRLYGVEGYPSVDTLAGLPAIVTSERWQRLMAWPFEKVVPLGELEHDLTVLINQWSPEPGSNAPGIWGTKWNGNDFDYKEAFYGRGWMAAFVQRFADCGCNVVVPEDKFFWKDKNEVRNWAGI